MINNMSVVVNIKKTTPSVALLNFNLMWHGQVMKNILLRYKIFFLFIILILAPTLSSLEFIVTSPTKNLISTHANSLAIIVSLMVYQGLGLIWILLQQSVFSNQPWDKYLISLPITKKEKAISEIFMLIIADTVIWVPLLLSGYLEIIKNHSDYSNSFLIIAKCIINIMLILLMQLAWRKAKYKILISVLVIDIVFIFLSAIPFNGIKLIVVMTLFVVALFQVNSCFGEEYKERVRSYYNKKLENNIYTQKIGTIFPFEKIQIANLILENSSQIIIPAASIILIFVLSIMFVKYGEKNSNLLLILSSCMLINGLILCNLFARLDTQRNLFLSYLCSLPIAKVKLFKSDMVLLGAILIGINLSSLLIALRFSLGKNYFFEFIITFLTPIIFLSATYYPQIRYKKYGFFVSLIVMLLFILVNYLLLSFKK